MAKTTKSKSANSGRTTNSGSRSNRSGSTTKGNTSNNSDNHYDYDDEQNGYDGEDFDHSKTNNVDQDYQDSSGFLTKNSSNNRDNDNYSSNEPTSNKYENGYSNTDDDSQTSVNHKTQSNHHYENYDDQSYSSNDKENNDYLSDQSDTNSTNHYEDNRDFTETKQDNNTDDRYSNREGDNNNQYSDEDGTSPIAKNYANNNISNRPINDPPYDEELQNPISKNGGRQVVEGTNDSAQNTPSPRRVRRQVPRSEIGLYRTFIEEFGDVRFYTSEDINQFFEAQTESQGFLDWFKDNVGGRLRWSERRFGAITSQNRRGFNAAWDQIPLMFTGGTQRHGINLFQFFALVSVMINEVGQKFIPNRERGSLRYMFGTVIPANENRGERSKKSYNNYPQRQPNNMTAFELFNNEDFLAAHSDLPNYNRVANTRSQAWNGSRYPSGFPTRPSSGGIIAEADFYKFSGRGLIQTTWSRNYIRLIDKVLTYQGTHPIILEYRNRWGRAHESLNLRIIASQTRNRDWDRLFMETDNEFAALAVYSFQEHRENFLNIPVDIASLRSTANRGGSIHYVGRRVGGRVGYGTKVKSRVTQMMRVLLSS